MDPIKLNWTQICENLKKEFTLTDTSYDTWIKPLEYYKTIDNVVYIIIQSDQTLQFDYITNKFTNCFKVIISEITGQSYDVKFVLKNDIEENIVEEKPSYVNEPTINKVINSGNLNPKYKFEDFVVGSNNKLAYSACLAVAETPGEVYNPLYIYGDPGLGKTHLMHSIGHMILEANPNKKVIYVTSEEFTNEVIESIRSGDASSMSKLRDKYRTVDVLMVDDIQFIIGKEATQEEFFHTFNTLHDAGKQIILSSDKNFKEFKSLDDRYISRFAWGMTVDITPPDYETRSAILKNDADKYNIKISEEIIDYIASNIKSNIRELEGALNKIIAFSKLNNNMEPDMDFAKEALKDFIYPSESNMITFDRIVDVVCQECNASKDAIMSNKRNADIVYPRHIIMYLAYDMLGITYQQIAHNLHRSDHTTVISGCKKIEADINSNKSGKNTREKVDRIKKILSGS